MMKSPAHRGLTRRVRNLTMGGSYHTREFLRTTPKPDTLEQAWLRVGRAMTQASASRPR